MAFVTVRADLGEVVGWFGIGILYFWAPPVCVFSFFLYCGWLPAGYASGAGLDSQAIFIIIVCFNIKVCILMTKRTPKGI